MVLERNYDYYSNRIKSRPHRLGSSALATRSVELIDIKELKCVRLLSFLYPSVLDFIITEFTHWLQTYKRVVTPTLMAAKFLWLCRTNKIPVTLNEISRDFKVSTKNIIDTLSDTNYVPPLGALDYISRISMQLNLPDKTKDRALRLAEEINPTTSTSPIIKACCAIILSAEETGAQLARKKIESAMSVTTAALQQALIRLIGSP